MRTPTGLLLQVGEVDRPGQPIPPRARFGIGGLRKIALIGTAATIYHAPWDDPTWEIWSHASAVNLVPQQRVDRWIDLHPPHCWRQPKRWHTDYYGWLKTLRTPIWMQKKYKDVPASVPFPKDRLLSEFGRYFTSQTAWMIGAALTEGVTHLGFFGVHYESNAEYRSQRAGCEWMMGVAFGRGVNLVLPPTSPLLSRPTWLYGYESHENKARADVYTEPPPQDKKITAKWTPDERPSSVDPFGPFRDHQRKMKEQRDELSATGTSHGAGQHRRGVSDGPGNDRQRVKPAKPHNRVSRQRRRGRGHVARKQSR
ncbi:MAG TPA: hypothetical protein VMY35_04790 [Phycisphaerae bacterium]|nr:hypothetical protein [Phycisphaerae bacterium]